MPLAPNQQQLPTSKMITSLWGLLHSWKIALKIAFYIQNKRPLLQKRQKVVTSRSLNRLDTVDWLAISVETFFLFTLNLSCFCDFIQSANPMTPKKPLPVNLTHVKTAAPVTWSTNLTFVSALTALKVQRVKVCVFESFLFPSLRSRKYNIHNRLETVRKLRKL